MEGDGPLCMRHEDTSYDELLMKGYDRRAARSLVWDEVEELLEAWRAGRPRRPATRTRS